jgi:hypothetical protein
MRFWDAREPLNKLCAAALRPDIHRGVAKLGNSPAIPCVLRLALKNSASQISSPKLVQRLPRIYLCL